MYVCFLASYTLTTHICRSLSSTHNREIGAGSAPAACGKYFSTHVPLIGRISKEHQEATLDGFEGVECVEIVARERCGKAVNASEEMDNFIINS